VQPFNKLGVVVTYREQDKAIDTRFCDLPSPPAVLIALIDNCNDPNASIDSLTAIIQKDAAITAQVIAAANSPLYRQWNEFTSLQQLLVVLGLNSVRTIAINSAVHHYFSKLGKQIGHSLELIWSRSLVCAVIARSLAELTAYPSPEEAYLAGLLHRLGQLLLLQSNASEYQALINQNLRAAQQIQAEQQAYATTFPLIGSQLIDHWELEGFLSDALRFQFEPAEAVIESSHLVKLVNLACHLVFSGDEPDNQAIALADVLFGLNQPIVEQLTQTAFEKAADAATSLGISFSCESQNSKDIDKHHSALGERVKQAALFGGSLPVFLDRADFVTTLQQIQRDLELMFGLKQCCFLLKDAEQSLLLPYCPSLMRQHQIDGLSINTDTIRSIAAWVYNHQAHAYSEDDAHHSAQSIADQQLMRLINSETMLYLPLTAQEARLGVLAIGLDSPQYPALSSKLSLLQLFAGEACKTLLHQQAMLADKQQLLDDERSAFQLEARKVVHEANNPLGIINNYLHILGLKLGEDHQVKEELEIIKDEINRVGKILLRIRDIPDELAQQEKRVDINGVINDLHKLFQSSLFATHDIITEVDLDADIPLISTRRVQLKQILTNLIKNAVEAIPEGGKLSITSRDNAYLNGKAHIEIQIIDSGPGIDPEIMNQLFLPGKSTKDSSHSGLGLAIVKSLMDELSGVINCTSNSKLGTRFQLFLPRTT
jgi:HD-like signal output (HDOD) protein/signal transduction histidine kinase